MIDRDRMMSQGITAVHVASPAAGTDWIVDVPESHAWRVLSISARLTTGAGAASRIPTVRVLDRARRVIRHDNMNGQTISAGERYRFLFGAFGHLRLDNASDPNMLSVDVGHDFWALSGWRVGSVTTGIQAADQWLEIVLTVEDYLYHGRIDA